MKWTKEYHNDTGPNDDYFEEWFEVTDGKMTFRCYEEEAADFLMSVLAQPKQEPAGVVAMDTSRPFVSGIHNGHVMPWSQVPNVKTVVMFKDLPLNTPLYDTPPREWVGLDFDTIEECFPEGPSVFEDAYGDNHTSPRWLHAFARAIESRLKEKNR